MAHPTSGFRLCIGFKVYDGFSEISDARDKYVELREEAVMNGGGGARDWPEGQVRSWPHLELVAHISYNGRLWTPGRDRQPIDL